MKKSILFFSMLTIGMISCTEKEKCTRCIEQNTKTVSTYCGTTESVEEYKTELIDSGDRYHQNWVCD